jgi:predicted MPP superfamily phosphohydrolase
MMWPVFPLSQTILVVAILTAVVLLTMRVVQPAWWRSRRRWTVLLVALAAIATGILLWIGGTAVDDTRVVCLGAGVTYSAILVGFPAVVALPLSGALDRIVARGGVEDGPKLSRRAMLRFGAGSFPVVAAASGASGLVSGREAPVLRTVPMRFPGLHPDLVGLKILQLSDLHLGAYRTPEDVERALASVKAHAPDLIVVTGDLADYPDFIPTALRAIEAAAPRFGAFACLGNHEYLQGIHLTRPLIEASNVPLLVGTGRTIAVRRARLFIGGSDDPVEMHGDIAGMVRDSIASAAREAPRDADFRLLLCHRPEGLGPAAENGFDLTLAGHTHGGQLGFLGRSLLEKVSPHVPWWGAYARPRPGHPRGPSRLYTTSGFGHWFPFRVGCPTEMALVVLEGGPGPAMTPVS